ncbi:MAG: MFS transporter [Lachnospiraceae bacterium]|nr:MFS transporter [Lachnospiraceae bacterium]
MYSILLALIYLAFISLGLPDSLLGSAWPVIQLEMGVPVSYAGIVTMIMSGGTIISSLLSGRLTQRFGAGLVTAAGVMMTAFALYGFSISSSFWMFCLFAVPYGLGGGSVDAAINNYVALHYSSRHMNWLHCFWGVGAVIGPYIMSYSLIKQLGWGNGYLSVSIIQIFLVVMLFISLPLWKRKKSTISEAQNEAPLLSFSQIIRLKGVKYVMVAFFVYCGIEATAFHWASTYLVKYRGIEAEVAASYAALFFIGITIGRFLSGIVSEKTGDRNMIRIGVIVMLVGITTVGLPLAADWPALYGLVIIGFGCAPIFPAFIHSTPANFGKVNSPSIIGIQMASAYTGSTFMPPLFGLLANGVSFVIYPFFMLVLVFLMLIMTEKLNKICA